MPPLPSEYRNVSGATFQPFTFDENVGKELCVVLLDDPQFSRELGKLKPFNLHATSGAVRTSAGVIGYIIWAVSSRRGHVVDYEHTLNPYDQGTIKLLSAVAKQSHIKVLVIDSISGQVVGFYELPNIFEFGKLAKGIAMITDNTPEANFAITQRALSAEFSLNDLKNLPG